jgi:hypothetical protein
MAHDWDEVSIFNDDQLRTPARIQAYAEAEPTSADGNETVRSRSRDETCDSAGSRDSSADVILPDYAIYPESTHQGHHGQRGLADS